VPLPAASARYFELVPLDDLDRTLSTLGSALTVGALVAVGGGAAIGRYASSRVLRPLHRTASVAGAIRAGERRRLDAEGDPDLEAVVDAFNAMVDDLERRIDREARFASNVSHELRTPLAAMTAAVDVMRRRNQSGRLDPEALDVRDFLAKIVGSLGDVHLEVEDGLTARLDPLVLERVLSNLLANARSYGTPPVLVHAARHDSTGIRFVVEDHGQGVPYELVPRLFDRFVRGHEGRGSGLGLAIARAYTAAHGGDLRYARARLGARFELILPGAAV
jgi:signal transduction histidine kinase